MKKSLLSSSAVALIMGSLLVGCGGGSSSSSSGEDDPLVIEPQPPVTEINGTTLLCDGGDSEVSVDAAEFNASQTVRRNISSTSNDPSSKNYHRESPTSHNTPEPLDMVVLSTHADGNLTEAGEADTKVHPIVVSYAQQIVGDYETGIGSADVGDPTHVDGVFVSYSRDNGDSWKSYVISDTTEKSSMQVDWNGTEIEYPGHAQKPTMAVEGNHILVAWNDKYCPSNNPFDLPQEGDDANATYPTDYFAVNGPQKSIDYEGATALPDGKQVWEVPFSCVWTARGIVDPSTGDITWHTPQQLTTGTRDSNHIWIASSSAGFAMSWQEDTVGLRSGNGEGPGDGWSGATTNHGSDIWYTSIKMDEFDDINGTDENVTKPKSLYKFNYPVRITDNEKCSNDDTKPYCQYICDTYGFVTLTTNNNQETEITRCKTYDTDMLTDTQVVLDGDTGASRSAIEILVTDQNEHVVILGYEETKGLSDSTPGEPDQDQGDSETNISVEGKSVYFESFKFDALDAFDETNLSTIQNVAMPLVSAGNIVNIKVPEQNNTSNMIYENARRLVIGTQVDDCEADKYTFAFMYKQSFETQGGPADMYVRVNQGFTYDDFVPLNGLVVTNVSSQAYKVVENIEDYNITWSEANLDDNTYDNGEENVFSPRLFLRGNNIYAGFEYTPNATKTAQENMPANFHIHRYVDGSGWQGPQNITEVLTGWETTVDARFFSTPEGMYDDTGLESDKSNPNVFFVTWGNVGYISNDNHDLGKAEGDLFYRRSTDGGVTWEPERVLSNREKSVIQEKEVESFASPDGKTIYNVWLQDEEEFNATDPDSGVDSWFGRVDYNISIASVPE